MYVWLSLCLEAFISFSYWILSLFLSLFVWVLFLLFSALFFVGVSMANWSVLISSIAFLYDVFDWFATSRKVLLSNKFLAIKLFVWFKNKGIERAIWALSRAIESLSAFANSKSITYFFGSKFITNCSAVGYCSLSLLLFTSTYSVQKLFNTPFLLICW